MFIVSSFLCESIAKVEVEAGSEGEASLKVEAHAACHFSVQWCECKKKRFPQKKVKATPTILDLKKSGQNAEYWWQSTFYIGKFMGYSHRAWCVS